jgi:large subunit ribosomal protein L6
MSRIGRRPIEVPAGVTIVQENGMVSVTGPLGGMSLKLMSGLKLEQEANQLNVSLTADNQETRQSYGLTRTLVANMVNGVSAGYQRSLEINGVGYRASVNGNTINLSLGFSHPVTYQLPNGVSAKVEKNIITLSGYDKQSVGQVAANLRALKPPEPYKGKGIKYVEERVRRKAGKAATKG